MTEEKYEGIRHTSKTGKPTYVMVPRKLLVAWITTSLILFLGVLANFQYTNYVDRRSNGFWCGVIGIFDDTYQKEPPTTETGRLFQYEFQQINKRFKCD